MVDPALLTLTQWLSPAFPTGAFADSHGLETVIARGAVHDGAGVEGWLTGILEHGAGWQDAVLLCCGLRAGADIDALDATARALAPSAERLRETLEQGAALARTVAGITGRALPPRALPVALAEAAAPLGLPPATVAALFLQGFAGNLCTIAIRHVPLGQTEGQAILARLHPVIAALADRAASATLDDLHTAALSADLAAMHHETQPVRIFRT
jgi:urease accessory protein